MSHTIEKTAAASLARCINRNKLYATEAQTAAWLKTPEGANIQRLINEYREKDRRRTA